MIFLHSIVIFLCIHESIASQLVCAQEHPSIESPVARPLINSLWEKRRKKTKEEERSVSLSAEAGLSSSKVELDWERIERPSSLDDFEIVEDMNDLKSQWMKLLQTEASFNLAVLERLRWYKEQNIHFPQKRIDWSITSVELAFEMLSPHERNWLKKDYESTTKERASELLPRLFTDSDTINYVLDSFFKKESFEHLSSSIRDYFFKQFFEICCKNNQHSSLLTIFKKILRQNSIPLWKKHISFLTLQSILERHPSIETFERIKIEVSREAHDYLILQAKAPQIAISDHISIYHTLSRLSSIDPMKRLHYCRTLHIFMNQPDLISLRPHQLEEPAKRTHDEILKNAQEILKIMHDHPSTLVFSRGLVGALINIINQLHFFCLHVFSKLIEQCYENITIRYFPYQETEKEALLKVILHILGYQRGSDLLNLSSSFCTDKSSTLNAKKTLYTIATKLQPSLTEALIEFGQNREKSTFHQYLEFITIMLSMCFATEDSQQEQILSQSYECLLYVYEEIERNLFHINLQCIDFLCEVFDILEQYPEMSPLITEKFDQYIQMQSSLDSEPLSQQTIQVRINLILFLQSFFKKHPNISTLKPFFISFLEKQLISYSRSHLTSFHCSIHDKHGVLTPVYNDFFYEAFLAYSQLALPAQALLFFQHYIISSYSRAEDLIREIAVFLIIMQSKLPLDQQLEVIEQGQKAINRTSEKEAEYLTIMRQDILEELKPNAPPRLRLWNFDSRNRYWIKVDFFAII